MTPDRWQQVSQLYHAALARDGDDRVAFLAEACGGDEPLRREVESLLAQPASAQGFLDGEALARAAQMVSDVGASVLTGRRLGGYQVQARLGAGGMGVVYRARDTKLGRDVAIKILPHVFTSDPERLARFEREARMLAALNHPHIGAIYGVEEAEGVRALVLELVEGDTLADRLQRGPVPVAEALAIARQIAEALEAAHEKGIIHRDLKPANIKVTPDGVVKVLDFGLAKASIGDGSTPDLTQSPTMTIGGTREGVILGTAAYMSPDQARGQAVDKRTDIWAFGCVLYELLTGRAVFARETMTDTLAAVIEHEPDWRALPAGVPAGVQRLLRRCLEKDSKRRLRDIGDVRLEIDEATAIDAEASAASDVRPTLRLARARSWALAAVVLVAIGALAWVLLSRERRSGTTPITRTTIALPADQILDTGGGLPLAIAPDGQRLVYVARSDGIARLYVRALDAYESLLLAGTEGAQFPFFSPDGRWVGFFANGLLKRVAIGGGAPLPICDVPATGAGGGDARPRGGTWAPDGTIVFDRGASGLMRVPATGGSPTPVTSRDSAMDARNLSWPEFLPDGRALIATVIGLPAPGSHLAVLSFDTGEWRVVGLGEQARYVASGYLVYHAPHVREGEVQAVGFDASRGAFRGEPFSVMGGVFRSPNGGSIYLGVSQSGTLVFAPGGLAHTLVRVDRNGRRTSLSDDRRGFRFPRISPDGRKVAVTIDPRPSEIWVYDIERRSRIPLVREGHSLNPVWTPDGTRIAYSTYFGPSDHHVYWRAADGSGAAELLSEYEYPSGWTGNGRALIVEDVTATNGFDIRIVPLGGDSQPLVATPTTEMAGRLSSDGNWIAYQSNESGRYEVYVRRFPNTNDGTWIVSTAGGHSPVWSPNGRELFYMTGATLMAVPVGSRGAEFAAGAPAALFSGPFDTTQNKNFDVFPDGSGFVMVEADPDARPTRLQVVLNWTEELKRLVPTK
jgi:Tol biopolymer transport system component